MIKTLLSLTIGFLIGIITIILSQSVFGESFAIIKQIELEQTKEVTGEYKQELYNGSSEIHVYEAPNKQFGYEIIEYINGSTIHTGYGIEEKERTYSTYKEVDYINSTSTDEKII